MNYCNLFPASRPAAEIGGSELLVAFLDEALSMSADRLYVLSPYVTDGVFGDNTFRNAWRRLLRQTRTTVVVRAPGAAEALLRASRPNLRDRDLLINARLHAKVFVASKGAAAIALAGSQNLTGAALHDNDEVGVLIRRRGDEDATLMAGVKSIVAAIVRRSVAYSPDSTGLPRYPLTDGRATLLQRRPLGRISV